MSKNRSPIRLEQLYRLRNRAAEETDPSAVEALNVAIHGEAEIGRRSQLANAPPLRGDLVVVVFTIDGNVPESDTWIFQRFNSSDAIILHNGKTDEDEEMIQLGVSHPRGYLGSTFFVHVDQAPLEEDYDPDVEIAQDEETFWQNLEAERDERAVEVLEQEDPNVIRTTRDRATDRLPWTPEEQRTDEVSDDMIDRDFDYMIEQMDNNPDAED